MATVQERAIALTLKDIGDGWATLWGAVHRFDPPTGQELSEPRYEFGVYDRDERPGLPDGWQDLFATNRWIELDTRPRADSTSPRWLVTDAGRAVMRQWLPDRLKGRPSS